MFKHNDGCFDEFNSSFDFRYRVEDFHNRLLPEAQPPVVEPPLDDTEGAIHINLTK